MIKKFKLGDICNLITDGTHFTPTYVSVGVPFLRVTDITESNDSKKFIPKEEHLELIKRCNPQKGDILYTKNGTIGVAKKIDWDYEFSVFVSLCLLKPKLEIVYTDYLVHYLNTELALKQALNHSKTATITNLHLVEIKKILIPLPSLPVQKKIAAILDAADLYRRQTRTLIEKYDQLAKSLFLEMFGDPVSNSKNWEVVKFSDVGKLDRGKSKHRPRNAPELLGGKYPLIQTGDIANSNGYLTTYKSTYSEIGLKQSKLWKVGTLCITVAANIAKTGILTFEACFPDSVVGFIPNSKTNAEFVQHWMSFLQKILEDSAPESAQKNINLEILRDLDIILPPKFQQTQFKERLSLIFSQKAQAQAALQKSESLFNSLLQKAFKGELISE